MQKKKKKGGNVLTVVIIWSSNWKLDIFGFMMIQTGYSIVLLYCVFVTSWDCNLVHMISRLFVALVIFVIYGTWVNTKENLLNQNNWLRIIDIGIATPKP